MPEESMMGVEDTSVELRKPTLQVVIDLRSVFVLWVFYYRVRHATLLQLHIQIPTKRLSSFAWLLLATGSLSLALLLHSHPLKYRSLFLKNTPSSSSEYPLTIRTVSVPCFALFCLVHLPHLASGCHSHLIKPC
jgi:hypothetical protein